MRILNRLLFCLRWPMALVAVTTALASVATTWFQLHIGFPSDSGPGATLYVSGGHLSLVQGALGSDFEVALYPIGEPEWRLGYFSFDTETNGVFVPPHVTVPLWFVAIFPAGFALAGFRARRRRHSPGQCALCGHTLGGATTCPECGCTTPAKHQLPIEFQPTEGPPN